MSLDQILMLPPGYGFDGAGGASEPTVFTLVLEELLSSLHEGSSQQVRLTISGTGISGTTLPSYI